MKNKQQTLKALEYLRDDILKYHDRLKKLGFNKASWQRLRAQQALFVSGWSR